MARYGPNAPWQQPEMNNVALPDVIFPAVSGSRCRPRAEMGVAIDGSDQWWPNAQTPAVLPAFSPYQAQPAQYIDVFNRGSTPFAYTHRARRAVADDHAEPAARVDKQVRATVRVDWVARPKGTTHVPITVTGAGRRSVVVAGGRRQPGTSRLRRRRVRRGQRLRLDDADHYTRAVTATG